MWREIVTDTRRFIIVDIGRTWNKDWNLSLCQLTNPYPYHYFLSLIVRLTLGSIQAIIGIDRYRVHNALKIESESMHCTPSPRVVLSLTIGALLAITEFQK